MWASLRASDDALAPFRDRVAVQLSALSAVLLLPFTALHLWHGRWALGLLIVAAQIVLAVTARALRAGRVPVVPLWLMTGSFFAAVCGAVTVQGVHGILWSYPSLFICYFLLARRLALLFSGVLVLAVTSLAAFVVDLPTAARVGATLTLTVVMINVVLGVIGDQQRALVAQTLTDPLTGAFNRRHLQARLDQLAAQAAKAAPQPQVHALLAIDIDHFKLINDRLGHPAGDRALRLVGRCMQEALRDGDLAGRLGGDEFSLLLSGATLHQAMGVAERIVLQLQAQSPEHRLPVLTLSFGLVQVRAGEDVDAALHRADQALYEAKRQGRSRAVAAAQDADDSPVFSESQRLGLTPL